MVQLVLRQDGLSRACETGNPLYTESKMRKARLQRFRKAVSRGRNAMMDGLDNFTDRNDDRVRESNDIESVSANSCASGGMPLSEINNVMSER